MNFPLDLAPTTISKIPPNITNHKITWRNLTVTLRDSATISDNIPMRSINPPKKINNIPIRINVWFVMNTLNSYFHIIKFTASNQMITRWIFRESIINKLISDELVNVKYQHKRFWERKWLKQSIQKTNAQDVEKGH